MNAKYVKAVKALFTTAFLCLALASALAAQEITATLVGTVRDSNGAVVPGATVTLTDPAKGNLAVRTATTNDEGEFTFPSIPVSTYDISVEAPNFKKNVVSRIKVDVGARRSVDVSLEAGNISETVTVNADAAVVDLQSATSGTVINGDQVRELSINNRNFVSLVTLAPGVTNDLDDLVFTGTNNPETQVVNRTLISVNGARATQNTFTVDGADVTDRGSNLTIQAYPSVDSIGEFRVLRSLYPAEAGQSGGGQVNVITRSGGDKFHGTLFEFIRNEAFNANSVAINSNPNPPFGRESNGKAKRRPFRYNNFGWTLGGPIYFLKFGEKDPGDKAFGKLSRTYFFYSQEFRRDTRYPVLSSIVPNNSLEAGIFPINICLRGTVTAGVGTCDPGATLIAGTPIGSVVPLSNIAQQYVSRIWSGVPNPTNPATFALDYPALNVAKFRQEVFKFDQTISDKVSWNYRLQRDTIPTTDADGSIGARSGMPFVNTMESDSPGRTHTASMTYVASPKLIIEGRYVYGYGAIFTTTTGLMARAVSPIPVTMPYPSTRDVVPQVSFLAGQFNSLTGFSNYDNFSWKGSISGDATWIFGSHTAKFGGKYSQYRKNENAIAGTNQGQFSGLNNTPVVLPAGQTAGSVRAPGVANTALNNSMQAWANFLQGFNSTFTQSKLDLTADLRQKTVEGYVQDEWRFRRNITLYGGVRYSFFGSPFDQNGHLSNFLPSLWNPAAAPQVTGAGNRVVAPGANFCNGFIVNAQNFQTGPPQFFCTPTPSPWGKHVYQASKLDFAPRVGLAWDPFGKGTTSVRMGYGIYHDQISGNAALLIVGLNPPYQETCTVIGTPIDAPVPGNNCTAQSSLAPASLRGIEADFKTPYMQHWSLDVQRQLTSKTVVTLGYYGSKGTNLNGFTEYNNLPPGVAATTQCAIGAGTLQNPVSGTQLCQTPGTAYTATPVILDQVRPFRGYRSINMLETRYNSNYHSLQVFAQHRLSGASQFNLAYTWSKNLTDNATSYLNHAPQTNSSIVSERGLAPLDRRHVITGNFVYELPFFKTQKNFIGKILGGWQASGIVSYQTGSAHTVTSVSYDPGGIGFIPSIVAGGRPNLTCDPNENAPHTVTQWFNTNCFSPQTATGIANIAGTAGRGVVEGPPTRKVDFTMSKNLKFSETMRLQLRAEAFNVFNITNFRLSTNSLLTRTAATFGQVTSFRDPRILQFGVKFYF